MKMETKRNNKNNKKKSKKKTSSNQFELYLEIEADYSSS